MANGLLGAIAAPATTNVIGAVQAGRQQRGQDLAGEILGSTFTGRLGALAQVDPNAALQLSKEFGIPLGAKGRFDSFVGSAIAGNQLLQAGLTQEAGQFLIEQADQVESALSQPGAAQRTRDIGQRILAGDPQAAQQLNKFASQLQLAQRGKIPETASKRDFEQFNRLSQIADATGDPEDQKKRDQFGRQAGFIRETEQEKADIRVDAAAEKEIAKATIKRKQGFIDNGIEAADSAATLKQSLRLLKNIPTGGLDDFIFKANQFFGVEGADELELSTNMGKSFITQLRPIFGSAFTIGEVNKLEAISAGFGRSTKGNIRLIEQTLKIVDRSARRGIAAAEDQEDNFAAQEIRAALAFNLDDQPVPGNEPDTVTTAGPGETTPAPPAQPAPIQVDF